MQPHRARPILERRTGRNECRLRDCPHDRIRGSRVIAPGAWEAHRRRRRSTPPVVRPGVVSAPRAVRRRSWRRPRALERSNPCPGSSNASVAPAHVVPGAPSASGWSSRSCSSSCRARSAASRSTTPACPTVMHSAASTCWSTASRPSPVRALTSCSTPATTSFATRPNANEVGTVLARVAALRHVVAVSDPYTTGAVARFRSGPHRERRGEPAATRHLRRAARFAVHLRAAGARGSRSAHAVRRVGAHRASPRPAV